MTLRELLAKASPARSGDDLAGIAAESAEQRVRAQMALADIPLKRFLAEPIVPYESDEVTRLICDSHDAAAFAPMSHLTVGEFRDWLLSEDATTERLTALAPGVTPEMAAAVCKLMRVQDLVSAAAKCRVVTRFRSTIGLPGRLATRLQPNHPTDDLQGIAASVLDGLSYGNGDAVIGVNPAGDNVRTVEALLHLLDGIRERLEIPTQICVLAHVTTQMLALRHGVPIDLVFQSIAGTEAANKAFGVTLAMLDEAHQAARELGRGENVMYFETGQGSALSADAHHGLDQQTCEARAYAVARRYRPLLVNTVVGFIGPEYLYDGKQIIRAGLEDHFCGKLLGLPMGCDVCYTNHAEADQDDMDTLLTLLGVAGCNYIMGVPGADDVMLHYQSTSFHDALYLRSVLGLKPAPEFEAWLRGAGVSACPAPESAPQARVQAGRSALLRPTPARIDLGRTGHSLLTGDHLDFQLDHARARDAVYEPLDPSAIGREHILVRSAVRDRTEYLHRPDLGRRLADASALIPGDYDAGIVIADGLSATAVHHHAPGMIAALMPLLEGWRMAPLVVALQGRVALGDEIGAAMGARMVVVLIGERPGLTSPDSLGIYLTWDPRPGRVDSERNCISNIRTEGITYDLAARKLHFLMSEARRRKLSGVELKDDYQVSGDDTGRSLVG
jgi:ethanolamine ammonia-lyase large subunit